MSRRRRHHLILAMLTAVAALAMASPLGAQAHVPGRNANVAALQVGLRVVRDVAAEIEPRVGLPRMPEPNEPRERGMLLWATCFMVAMIGVLPLKSSR